MNTLYFRNQTGEIAYDISGKGPLVICVPSMGDIRSEYRIIAPELISAGYAVATMDVRGHGESSTQWQDFSVAGVGSDILALIRILKRGPAVILGTSMAAGAAVWAAAEAPELIAGIILIDPFVRGESHWKERILYSVLFSRPWGPALWIKYYNGLYPSSKPADFNQYSQNLKLNLSEQGRMEALYQMMIASKTASEKRLPLVKTPSMILMGSRDPDFKNPAKEAERLSDLLHTQYFLIEGAGHYPHAEMVDKTLPLILSFLRKEASYVTSN